MNICAAASDHWRAPQAVFSFTCRANTTMNNYCDVQERNIMDQYEIKMKFEDATNNLRPQLDIFVQFSITTILFC